MYSKFARIIVCDLQLFSSQVETILAAAGQIPEKPILKDCGTPCSNQLDPKLTSKLSLEHNQDEFGAQNDGFQVCSSTSVL